MNEEIILEKALKNVPQVPEVGHTGKRIGFLVIVKMIRKSVHPATPNIKHQTPPPPINYYHCYYYYANTSMAANNINIDNETKATQPEAATAAYGNDEEHMANLLATPPLAGDDMEQSFSNVESKQEAEPRPATPRPKMYTDSSTESDDRGSTRASRGSDEFEAVMNEGSSGSDGMKGKKIATVVLVVLLLLERPMQLESVKVLLEKEVILVRHSLDVHKVRVALKTALEENEIFLNIAKHTQIEDMRDLRLDIATVQKNRLRYIEIEMQEMMHAHGATMDELKVNYDATKQHPAVAMEKARSLALAVDEISLKDLFRKARGLLDLGGELLEAIVGTPSARTHKKTVEMIEKLGRAQLKMADGLIGVLNTEKQLGGMIKDTRLSLLHLQQAELKTKNILTRHRDQSRQLMWTLMYKSNADSNVWALSQKLAEIRGILRSGKQGRMDEKLFGPKELHEILLKVQQEAARMGGDSVYAKETTMEALYKIPHVITTLTSELITQTVRFPVVDFDAEMEQQIQQSWPAFFLTPAGGEGKMYLMDDVTESAECDAISDWYVCSHRPAITWASASDAYIVEERENSFRYMLPPPLNESDVYVTCGRSVIRITTGKTKTFDLHNDCSASIPQGFTVAEGAQLNVDTLSNLEDGLKFTFERENALLDRLPPLHRLIQLNSKEAIQQLVREIDENNTQMMDFIDEGTSKAVQIKKDLSSITASHWKSRDYINIVATIAVAAAVMTAAVLVYSIYNYCIARANSAGSNA